MKPTLGRIVLYVLTAADAEAINASRGDELTPQRGNRAEEGQIFPSMVVAVLPDDVTNAAVNPAINLKVQLDGTDTYWATSRYMSDDKAPGTWHWMEYQKQVAADMKILTSLFPQGDTAPEAANTTVETLPVTPTPLEVHNDDPAELPEPPVELADAEGKPLDVAPEQTPEELEKLKEEVGF